MIQGTVYGVADIKVSLRDQGRLPRGRGIQDGGGCVLSLFTFPALSKVLRVETGVQSMVNEGVCKRAY